MMTKLLNRKQIHAINQIDKYIKLKDNKIFTKEQLNKLVELVACSYIYNKDMKTGTPQEQRLLKNIYEILTGNDNPERER